MINGREETRRGLAAIYNKLVTNRQRVNAISFVTFREEDTKTVTKTTLRWRFPFSCFSLLVQCFLYATQFMIIPFVLLPLVRLCPCLFRQQIWRLTLFFSFSILVDTGRYMAL